MTPLPICALCGTAAGPRFLVDSYAIHRCDGCDFEWVYPPPSAHVLAELYGGAYFVGSGLGYGDYFTKEAASHKRKAEARIALVSRLAASSGRLLDFGAASGVFVGSARAHGWDAVGVEPSSAARDASDEDVQASLFASLQQVKTIGPFRVVTAWDVLEHLPDALQVLTQLSEVLAPNGLLAVVVPIIDNMNARFSPKSWDQYKPPEHVTFFSRKSLKKALEQTVGSVIHVEPAWERYNRHIGLASPSPSRLTRGLGRFESSVAKALAKLRVLPPRWFEDSVLMIARKEYQPA